MAPAMTAVLLRQAEAGNRRVVKFYNGRGTAEQLHALAYNLANFMRTLALPEEVEQWSLTTLREKLVKIGAEFCFVTSLNCNGQPTSHERPRGKPTPLPWPRRRWPRVGDNMVVKRPSTAAEALHAQLNAKAKRQEAELVRGIEPASARFLLLEAQQLDAHAEAVLKVPEGTELGTGREFIPTDIATKVEKPGLVDTTKHPDLVTLEASRQRLELIGDARCLTIGAEQRPSKPATAWRRPSTESPDATRLPCVSRRVLRPDLTSPSGRMLPRSSASAPAASRVVHGGTPTR